MPEATPSPRASSGHRDTSLLPKKILLNAHTKFILGFANPIQQVKRQQCSHEHGAHATSPQHSQGNGSGLYFPAATQHLLSYTLPHAVSPRWAALSPVGLRGLPKMGGSGIY